MKKLLLLLAILPFAISCNGQEKIEGSWFFIDYVDEPYSKSDLKDFEMKIKNEPSGWIKSFNYIFKKDGSYEYIIYNTLTSKGTYTMKGNEILLDDKLQSKKDTFKIKYLDAQFLQMDKEAGRISIYYKTQHKFPEPEVGVARD